MHDRDELDEFLSQQLATLRAPSGYEERVLAGTHTRVRRIRRRRNIAVGVSTLAVGGIIAGTAVAAPGLLRADEPLQPAGTSSALPAPNSTDTTSAPTPTTEQVATPLPAPTDLPTATQAAPTTAPTPEATSTTQAAPTTQAPTTAATTEPNATDDPSVPTVAASDVPITADLFPAKSDLPEGTTYWSALEPNGGPAVGSDVPALEIYDRTPIFNGLSCDVAPEEKGTQNNIGSGVMESVDDPDERNVSLNLGIVDTAAGRADQALAATLAGDGVCILGPDVTHRDVTTEDGHVITVLQLGPRSSVALSVRGDRVISASASDLFGRAGMSSQELDSMALSYAGMMLDAQIKAEAAMSGANG